MRHPIKHSVLIITYNQENIVARAVNSLLVQKEYIYEIVINDDCSTDNTWNVILEFQKQYPELIKPHRNGQNLGIFANEINGLRSLTGDVISLLAGDDYYKPGLFKEMNELIYANDFDLENDHFILFFNHETLYPDGRKILIDNSSCFSNSLFKLKLRWLIGDRGIGISKSVIKKIDEIPTGLGIHSDMLLDIQFAYYATTAAYSPFVAGVYNAGGGISSRTSAYDHYNSLILNMEALKKIYSKDLDNDDNIYLSMMIMIYDYCISPSLGRFLKTAVALVKNRTCFLSDLWFKENLKECFFVLIKSIVRR